MLCTPITPVIHQSGYGGGDTGLSRGRQAGMRSGQLSGVDWRAGGGLAAVQQPPQEDLQSTQEEQERMAAALAQPSGGAMHVINMLLELDSAGQLPVVVFNLNRSGCTRRVLAVAGWLKACLAEHVGRSYEDLLAEQEELRGALRKARGALEDAKSGGKRPSEQKVEQLEVRRRGVACAASAPP